MTTSRTELWYKVWQECYDEAVTRSPQFSDEEFYASGRASKANPDKEDPAWWYEHGPEFVDTWVAWRDQCGLGFAEVADYSSGEIVPAIELEVYGYAQLRDGRWETTTSNSIHEDNLVVRSFIDRVMEDKDGTLYIVDLKSGTYTQPWPLQLILNNLCLESAHGLKAKWGGYWSARKGGVMQWHDLSTYPDEWVWDQVRSAREIRDRQLFLANPGNLCASACGVRQHCVAMGGTPYNQPLFLGTVQP